MAERKKDTGYKESEKNVHKNMNPEEYEKEIEHTRGEIDETLSALEGKLSPREMWHRTVDEWGAEIKTFSGNLGKSVRDNPLPVTLMGISLLWLMAEGKSPKHETGYSGLERRKSNLREKYEEMKSRAGEKVSGVSEKMQHRKEEMGEKEESWRRKSRAKASDLSGRPILLAAAGLALGSIAAMSLPTSRKEEEVLVPEGEKMYEKAREFGREKMEEGEQVAATAGERAKEEMGKSEEEKKAEREKVETPV